MKILLIQLRRLGDVTTITPAIRALKKSRPNALIDVLTEAPGDQVVRYNPHINEVLVMPSKAGFLDTVAMIKEVRRRRYDIVADFFCNPTSAYVSFFSGVKVRLGMSDRFRRHFYTNLINKHLFPPYLYSGIHKLALLAHIGVMHDGFSPEFPISREIQAQSDAILAELGLSQTDKLVTIGASTREKFRQWPAQYSAFVADNLIERYQVKILLVYGPGEEEFAADIASLMKHKPLPMYPSSKNCGVAIIRGFFERSVLHIGCDNGISNVAKASGIPVITLFSSDFMTSWTPPGDPKYMVVDTPFICEYKLDHRCMRDKCPAPLCITSITPEMVLSKAYKALDHVVV